MRPMKIIRNTAHQRNTLTLCSNVLFTTLLALCGSTLATEASRPNILWIVVDDMSANLSCYGESVIQTPHIDSIARNGLQFNQAYATSPVCSTFRSSLITGMYQTTIGAHHHRSGRGKHRITLPPGVIPLPTLFQQAGYYTCMGSGLKDFDFRSQTPPQNRKTAFGKSDYNFTWDRNIFDGNDWSGRDAEQPFFMQVQLHGGKLRGASEASYSKFEQQVTETLGQTTDPASVHLPPYYPDDSVMRRDWSTYLDSVRITDWHVGKVLARLKEEGLSEQTLVIFFTDHGISHARGKQFLYDEGTHIPLVLSGPNIPAGAIREDLVEHIDIAALSLAAADIEVPTAMQGRDLLSNNYQPKEFVFAARDRCGEADDRIRSVRSERYLYIRNFYPSRPHLMPSNYKDGKLIIQRLRRMHAEETLNPLAKRILFAPERPAEELYLRSNDPWQITNLANSPAHFAELKRHRKTLNEWIVETDDQGPESDETYALEIADQMGATKNAASREQFRRNSEIYKAWRAAGE
ncbi:MAG: sulfatase family protein [Rubripirellula sp.]